MKNIILSITVMFVFLSAIGFSAELSSCGTIIENSILISDISASGTCFEIGTSNVVLDCQGYTISGDDTGIGIRFTGGMGGPKNVTVKNCIIEDFLTGVSVGYTQGYHRFENITVNSSSDDGFNFYRIGRINLTNVVSNYNGGNGFYLEQSGDNNFTQFEANYNGGDGIHIFSTVLGNGNHLQTSSNNFFKEGILNSNTGSGIYSDAYTPNNVFEEIVVNQNGEDGIYLFSCQNCDFKEIIANNNEDGICFARNLIDSNLTNVTVNLNSDNGLAIEPDHYKSSSYGNLLINITAESNDDGFHLEGFSKSNVTFSNVKNNTNGILLKSIGTQETSIDNIFKNNTLEENGHGIYFDYFIDNNLVYHNDFVSNTIQSYDGSDNEWDNGSEGNYWSDYEGVDDGSDGRTVGDGIGDTEIPHNLDNYPLMNMVGFEEEAFQIKSIDSCQLITESVVLTENITGLDRTCFIIKTDNVTFDCQGHSISGTGRTRSARGFHLNRAKGITIKNCEISGFANGINLFYGEHIQLENIIANENTVGVNVNRGKGNHIENSTMNKNKYGIYLYKSSDNTVKGVETKSNTRYGLYVKRSNNNLFEYVTSELNGRYDLFGYKNKGNSVVDCDIDKSKER